LVLEAVVVAEEMRVMRAVQEMLEEVQLPDRFLVPL
jgi:hypothetical protein